MNNMDIIIGFVQAIAALIMIVVTVIYVVITNKILKVTKYQTLKSIQQNLNSSRLSLLKIKLDYMNMAETTEVSEARILVESEIISIDEQLKKLNEKITMPNTL